MTEDLHFAVIQADLDEQEEMDHMQLAIVPKVADLEQKNEAIQAAYDLWHALHQLILVTTPVPGLCPQENEGSEEQRNEKHLGLALYYQRFQLDFTEDNKSYVQFLHIYMLLFCLIRPFVLQILLIK